MRTFIDEAGNTGCDLIQQEQPFFVLSAITLKDACLNRVLTELKTQFLQYKEKEEVEIKAAKWSKSTKKAKALQNIIEKVIAENGRISVVIIEKRYMISAMIVDVFFDPVYNSIKDEKWIHNTIEKIKAVNYFYSNLSDAVIYKLWGAIQELDKQKLGESLNLMVQSIKHEEYKKMLEGAYDNLDELINDSKCNRDEKDMYKIRLSPNYTSFPTVMNPVIHYCREIDEKTTIIFDSAIEFNESYRRIYEMFVKVGKDIPTPNGNLYSWQESVENLIVANSKNEIGLQIADIISSSINQLMLCALNNKSISQYNLFNIALLEMLKDDAWYVISKDFYKKYHETKLRGISLL